MKHLVGKKPDLKKKLHMIWPIAVLLVAVPLLAGVFTYAYRSYTDNVLYEERLGQMQNVTSQLFTGLEDVIDSQWYIARTQTARMERTQPDTVEMLKETMQTQAELGQFETLKAEMVAVDNRGRYYTEKGIQGLFSEMGYLEDLPDQLSFVDNSVTKDRTSMFFLCKLKNPITIEDGDNTVRLLYYGISREMTELDQYFNCDVYEGESSVYVLDKSGIKMFTGTNNSNSIQGMNVYKVLQNMDYLHEADFDSVLESLEEKGSAYSNAILDGEEIYYSLYQMKNASWTLLFLVPSRLVAVNTVDLVDSTTQVVLTFSAIMLMLCIGIIYWLLRRQQRQELEAAEQNNEKLASVNRKLDEKNRVLESTNQKLEAAQEAAEQARELAEEASRAKTDFLANMSHDIRTPMNAIVGITSLMEHEQGLTDKLENYIQKVQLSSRHLLGLINDILDMSRIESQEVQLNVEEVSLAEQVGQIDSIIRAQANEHNQNFRIEVKEIAHEYLVCDGTRLRQICLNLLSNAVKYTPDGGHIMLELAEVPCDVPKHARFVYTVTDDGYGMSGEFLEHIFEPFTRAEDSMTNKVQGTGLGMAITKNIVDLMGGEIRVDSEPGKGSRFEVTLTLPVSRNADYEIGIQRVLLVSGENQLIRNVAAAMSKTDIQFCVVATKKEASSWLLQESTDVILLAGDLLDKSLPETAELLRKASKEATLIFCMDYLKDDVQETRSQSGIDGIIPRPFFLYNLARAIAKTKTRPEADPDNNEVLKGMRFLCAEDNELNAEILQELLHMYGASCDIYPDGEQIVEAFKNVKEGDYDAILMDVQMPKKNGLEATREIRTGENPLGATIPIIAMTANAFSEDVQHCLGAGMDAHISKPLDIDTLEKTLRGLMSGGGQIMRRAKKLAL